MLERLDVTLLWTIKESTSFFTGFVVTVILACCGFANSVVCFALCQALTVWKETLEIALSVCLFN